MQRGYILLAGGAEFGGRMQIPDHRAIDLAGGAQSCVRILPAAAAPDNNHWRAGSNGVEWFRKLGVVDVEVVPLIDRRSADEPDIVAELQRSRLIYLLGGFAGHLANSLHESLGWRAILDAHRSGAVIAGSSAGAMVLCGHYYDPPTRKVFRGLGLLPGTCFLPHHDTFGRKWVPDLTAQLPVAVLVGVDEETAILNDGPSGRWTVWGAGSATIYRSSGSEVFRGGETFSLGTQAI